MLPAEADVGAGVRLDDERAPTRRAAVPRRTCAARDPRGPDAVRPDLRVPHSKSSRPLTGSTAASWLPTPHPRSCPPSRQREPSALDRAAGADLRISNPCTLAQKRHRRRCARSHRHAPFPRVLRDTPRRPPLVLEPGGTVVVRRRGDRPESCGNTRERPGLRPRVRPSLFSFPSRKLPMLAVTGEC